MERGKYMFCPKCGKDARNQATFCNHCGAAMPQIATPFSAAEPATHHPVRKSSATNATVKKRIIIVPAVAGILVITSCVSIGIYRAQTAAQRQVREYLERGKYMQAAEYYQKHSDEIKTEKLLAALEAAVSEIYDDYVDEEKSYQESTDLLDTFHIYSLEGIEQLVADTDQKMQMLSASRSAYLQAEQAKAREDYAQAIVLYRQVISDDPQYDTAQVEIDTCYALYTGDILDRAAEYQSNHYYADALKILKEASEILKDDEQINAALNTCVSEYKTLLFSNAEEYAADGDYEYAAEYLMEYVESFPDGDDLQEKANQYMDLLMDSLLKEANDYIKKGDYSSAILAVQNVKEDYPENDRVQELEQSAMSAYLKQQLPLIDAAVDSADYLKAYTICKNALELMPNNNELLTRMETIDAKRPILLNEVVISECNDCFEIITDLGTTYYDTVGNEYHSGNLFIGEACNWGGSDSPYATFHAGAQYKTLTGLIAVKTSTSMGSSGDFKIYGDGELLYSSSFNRTTVPKQVSIDVSGVTWLKFVMTSNTQDFDYILSDFTFTKLGA